MRTEKLYREHGLPTHALIPIRVSESEEWVKLFASKMYKHIVSNKADNPYLVLFLALVFSMGRDNCFYGTQVGLANEMQTSPSTVSRGLKKLETLGFIRALRSPGGHQGWFINPAFAFRGTPKARRECARVWSQLDEKGGLFE